jgi:hypothetical protein
VDSTHLVEGGASAVTLTGSWLQLVTATLSVPASAVMSNMAEPQSGQYLLHVRETGE